MTTAPSTTNATPVDAPAGHNEAMAAKFDAANAGKPSEQPAATPPAGERPAWLPAKFATAEDMARSYAELEAKNSAPKDPAKDTPAAEVPADPNAAKATVEAAGLDFGALTTEFNTDGALSEATYAKLAEKGIPKETVDAYIAGQQALAEQGIAEILTEVGGPDEYAKIVGWAAKALPKAQIDAFNTAMDSGTSESIKLTIAGLKARFEAANGKEPNLLNGGNGQSSTDVFRSTAEMTTAMKDPRYSKDPAYRREVQEKVGRSDIL